MAASHPRPPSTPSGGPPWPIWLLIVVVAVGAAVVFRPSRPPSADPSPDASTAAVTPAVAAGTNSNPAFRSLIGKWVREDGGYVLEIRSVDAEGKLQAAYFNPNAIHIAQARSLWENQVIKVFVELQDHNYPGCLYTLAFDPRKDRLTGSYFQAALGETYEVEFVRMQ